LEIALGRTGIAPRCDEIFIMLFHVEIFESEPVGETLDLAIVEG
jgi:hypothetical protein